MKKVREKNILHQFLYQSYRSSYGGPKINGLKYEACNIFIYDKMDCANEKIKSNFNLRKGKNSIAFIFQNLITYLRNYF